MIRRHLSDTTPTNRTAYRDSGDWRDEGLCLEVDPELFYPLPGSNGADAKALCRKCPVRLQCATYAIETEQVWGIWGGMSESKRVKLIRAKRRAEREKKAS